MEQQGKQLLFSNMVSLSYHSLMYKMNKTLLKKKSIIKKKHEKAGYAILSQSVSTQQM